MTKSMVKLKVTNVIIPNFFLLFLLCLSSALLKNAESRQILVVAGNFSLDGELVNLAEYDISAGV